MDHSLAARGARLRHFAQAAQARLLQLFASEMPAWAFFLDFAVYPPLIVLCLTLAFGNAGLVQGMLGLLMLASGLAIWTLAEYLIHRFAFHHAPLLKPIHMAHHHAPRDLNGTPTVFTVILFYLLVYLPLSALFGQQLAAAGVAGVMAGYLAYVAVHYVVHHLGSGGLKPLRRLIKLHAVHHHDTKHNFGVTTGLWDRVFGTLARR